MILLSTAFTLHVQKKPSEEVPGIAGALGDSVMTKYIFQFLEKIG